MKPAPFEYILAGSVADATAALRDLGDDGKVLAGGQSLLPLMNFRLARPEALVDIGRLTELSGVQVSGQQVVVGALTRHLDLQRCTLAGPLGTLLRTAARHVGHLPIRTRGTFGGSLAHADPAAEWCVLARLLDATMTAVSTSGSRDIPAADYFETIFTTALAADELLTEIRLPRLDGGSKVALAEFARRPGDFALVAVMACCRMSGDLIETASICLGGAADRPLRSPAAEDLLAGRAAGATAFRQAGEAAADTASPSGDIHASAGYRRDLVRALVPRALAAMAA